jgi:hypothetical protein
MKKMIMSVMLVLTSSLLFYVTALATNVGDLEENLRIKTIGCVRPILIFSDNDKVNVYITGEMIKSATILSGKKKRRGSIRASGTDLLYIEGELYFDFKDENVRKNIVEKIKEMIRVHEENVKLNQETGKDIPYPESADSYFYGSFVPGNYSWGASDSSLKREINNFRFLTMKITVTLPFSEQNDYDVAQSNVSIDRRCFHSGKPLKICNDGKLYTGVIDPLLSMSANGYDGQFLLNVRPDAHVMDNLNPKQRSTLQNAINNIILYMIKTNKSVPRAGPEKLDSGISDKAAL